MRTVLIILGVWLLINVLFVVIMIPPRKPRKPNQTRPASGLAPVTIGRNVYAYDEDEKVSLRHTIIAIAMGTALALAPPLLEAIDDIKRMIGKYRKPQAEAAGEGRSLDKASSDLRTQESEQPSDRSSSGAHDVSKH
ncbi:phosphonate metabolism protein PhnM [Bradyrhizobium manausense]|uniref:phosphonate metabolism protein PhnM n=1 Tax=Bradyrhizobium manausense TaxID=989370 RepID=UPI001BAC205D|nr:phosphonate metabolism protein PhnM [Bradyrhizobium manausense]MBR0789864.1 phosphonate metabolism protein PhnM [Bradyrhizobium manausense]